MAFEVILEPRAILDIQDAIDYYDQQLVGLGERFKLTIDHYLQAISRNPNYQIRYKDYRALPTGKFPYLILFTVDDEEQLVYVMAIFHSSQSPEKLP
ncbi:MAG: type II toxin-antitoxin system RelE/ParE family toxin [Flavobacteriales bacterium]